MFIGYFLTAAGVSCLLTTANSIELLNSEFRLATQRILSFNFATVFAVERKAKILSCLAQEPLHYKHTSPRHEYDE